MAALTGLQFGHPCTVGDTEGVHVRVLTEILQLTLLVVRVHRHQHGTDLGSGIEERQPVGHVRRPDTHVRASLHTDGDQSLGEVVHSLVELAPGEAQVTVTIDDIFFIGRSLSPVFKPLAEGALMECIALTAGLGRIGPVWQRSACHI